MVTGEFESDKIPKRALKGRNVEQKEKGQKVSFFIIEYMGQTAYVGRAEERGNEGRRKRGSISCPGTGYKEDRRAM